MKDDKEERINALDKQHTTSVFYLIIGVAILVMLIKLSGNGPNSIKNTDAESISNGVIEGAIEKSRDTPSLGHWQLLAEITESGAERAFADYGFGGVYASGVEENAVGVNIQSILSHDKKVRNGGLADVGLNVYDNKIVSIHYSFRWESRFQCSVAVGKVIDELAVRENKYFENKHTVFDEFIWETRRYEGVGYILDVRDGCQVSDKKFIVSISLDNEAIKDLVLSMSSSAIEDDVVRELNLNGGIEVSSNDY